MTDFIAGLRNSVASTRQKNKNYSIPC